MFRSTAKLATVFVCLTLGTVNAQTAAPGPAPAGAPAQALEPAALDELLGPIALYPDALVIQILQCASSSYQVNQVSTWLRQHPSLRGTAAQDAASVQGFDANFVAVVLFPEVLYMMADDPQWTRELGQAFTTDRDAVFASIQRLRSKAEEAGNLQSNDQQRVQTIATDEGEEVIAITPANPQVVYVPEYDSDVVYIEDDDDDADRTGAGLVGFAAGVIVGAAANDDDDEYYYGYGGWGYGGAVLYPAGYQDFYRHRENMAEDYYRHRENMAEQRRTNRGERQEFRSQADRAARQGAASERLGTDQATRQAAARQADINRAALSSRGAYGSSQPSWVTSGRSAGAFSGYQRGSVERQSSSRGRSSMSRSSSGSRGGGGARGGGGGRSGGGGRR
jgi:hypothetical protein